MHTVCEEEKVVGVLDPALKLIVDECTLHKTVATEGKETVVGCASAGSAAPPRLPLTRPQRHPRGAA